MNKKKAMHKKLLATLIPLLASTASYATIETSIGKANVDLRLRFENVTQDNALEDASALTLRTTANFKTNAYSGFYGFVELENSVALIEDYNSTQNGEAGYSVIADPATTELDQAYVGYKNDGVSVKLGRQVITMDNHRFVGHVGWRNDKQTFDALSATYDASEKLKLSAAYITKRNRIFADAADIDASDILLNAALKTEFGTVTGYGYLLETDNGTDNSLNTFGARLTGAKSDISYTLEFATQTNESSGIEYDTSYMLGEVGTKFGGVSVKAGYESLGSDDGVVGFTTPLATLHKFNGWSDQFLGTPGVGLNDLYATIAGKAGGGKWSATFHSYAADEASATVDDLGTELNVIYTTKISDFPVGIKYAMYTAGDQDAGKVDTDKLWIWTGYKF
ncbi:alginate export family protein [uncultured Psychrosphaera sp.]|uniref:alginate export family protein n=1 Tax=uncultured Psychrosphaera sp. TaxID=1403522 RepID=UPI00262C1491|nr:alginate export family protein [uncultured Psychrosphaera sp.]